MAGFVQKTRREETKATKALARREKRDLDFVKENLT